MDYNEYIHLISHPTDDKGSFINRLGKSFNFTASDEIYVGLKEMSIPCDFASEYIAAKSDSDDDKLRLAISCPYYSGNKFVEAGIPNAYYTPQSLVTLINSRISAALGPSFPDQNCRLYFNPVTKHIEFFCDGENPDSQKRVSLCIFPSVTKILGLQHKNDRPATFLVGANTERFPAIKSQHPLHAISKYPPGIKTFDLLLVYLSILKRQNIGDTLAPISEIFARTDCVKGHHHLTYRVTNPKYTILSDHLRTINEIEAKLCTENGDLIKFGKGSGETRITLHLVSKSWLKGRMLQ